MPIDHSKFTKNMANEIIDHLNRSDSIEIKLINPTDGYLRAEITADGEDIYFAEFRDMDHRAAWLREMFKIEIVDAV